MFVRHKFYSLNSKLKNTLRRCWTFSWLSIGLDRAANIFLTFKFAGKLFGRAFIVVGLRIHETAVTVRENDGKDEKDEEWVIHRNSFQRLFFNISRVQIWKLLKRA